MQKSVKGVRTANLFANLSLFVFCSKRRAAAAAAQPRRGAGTAYELPGEFLFTVVRLH